MEFSIPKQFWLLILTTFCYTLIQGTPIPTSSSEFIKTSCSSTTYPRLCFSSLSIHANSIQTSPKNLASAALSVSLSSAKSATSQILTLSKNHGIPRSDVSAVQDCLEELSDSVDSLRQSMAEMTKLTGSSDFDLTMNNLQTWVSAALTDETTCSDGLRPNAVVRSRIVNVARLTSNALSLINRMADLHR